MQSRMTLKAVLFDFNGVIINDEPIHRQLIDDIMIAENLRPQPGEYRRVCLGKSDRAALSQLLAGRGRMVTDNYLNQLMFRKAQAYQVQVAAMAELPIYGGVVEAISKLQAANLKLAIVSGALRGEIEIILNRAGLTEYFATIVAGDDITTSKPEPDGYLLAVERLNQLYPQLHLQPSECLAIEDTLAGIAAAKRAGIPVAGVTHTYPFHVLHRQANWTVDYFADLELEWLERFYAG